MLERKRAKQALWLGARRFVEDEGGAALWEYALGIIVGLGIISVIIAFRDRIAEVFVAATSSLTW